MTAYSGRRYVFGIHGWAGYERRRFRRQTTRRRRLDAQPWPRHQAGEVTAFGTMARDALAGGRPLIDLKWLSGPMPT